MALISLAIGGALAILIGLLVLIFPKLLRVGVGLYLIVWGILQLIAQYY